MCTPTSKKLCLSDDCEICFERSFASHPKAKMWSPENKISAREVFKRARTDYLFFCDACKHEYSSSLTNITRITSKGCPFCCGQRLCESDECKDCFEKSAASEEAISRKWSSKNNISPRSIFKKSEKTFWFDCENCNHSFQTQVFKIGNAKENCVYCSKKALCDDENCKWCFGYSFASHPKAERWSPKNKKKPRDCFISSKEKAWFDCNVCGHDFEMIIRNITGKNASWCSFCSNTQICEREDCKICFEKSFASHPKAERWSPKNEKKPREVFRQSNLKYWFNCDECNHELYVCLSSIGGNTNGWCIYCANQKLCEDRNCDICFRKSLACHDRIKWWSKRNDKDPRDIALYSNQKAWFDCDACDHKFESTICNITKKQNPTWCPYCAGQLLCDRKECRICFERSFASHPKAKFWDKTKNKISPREVTKGTGKKYHFVCEEKHNFCSVIANISRLNSWCPKCTRKAEKRILDWLYEKYGEDDVDYQFKPEWCKSPETGLNYSYDFYILSLNIIIELDGGHHFNQVMNWETPERTQSKDLYKMKKAFDEKLSLIRIPWDYVCTDELLEKYKKNIETHLYISKSPKIIFMGEKDEYAHFKDLDFSKMEIPEIIPKRG